MPPQDDQQPQAPAPGQQFAPQNTPPPQGTAQDSVIDPAPQPQPQPVQEPVQEQAAQVIQPLSEPIPEGVPVQNSVAELMTDHPDDEQITPEPTPVPAPVMTPVVPEQMPVEPQPEPLPSATNIAPQPQPAPMPQQILQPAPQPAAGAPKPAGKGKKIVIILGAVLFFGALIAGGAFYALNNLVGSAPTYNATIQESLPGFSTGNSGMRFDVPEGFEVESTTDTSAAYFDFVDGAESQTAEFAHAGIRVEISFITTGETSDQVASEFFANFEDLVNDPEQIEQAISSEEFKNPELVSFSKDEENRTARVEFSGQTTFDGQDTESRSVVLVKLGYFGYLYMYEVFAQNEVWDKNSQFFEDLLNSVEIDQAVSLL